MKHDDGHIEADWARLGIALSGAPARRSPDLEQLLVATPSGLNANPRLFLLVVTWLVENGSFVAVHRLKHLARELAPRDRAALGLILETAIAHGARGELRVAAAACRPVSPARPLFDEVYRGVESIPEETATALSRKWGLWVPEVELKRTALRPIQWVLEHNPRFRDRAIRKGDLRCSILEALRHDAQGAAPSELELARLTDTTRAAVRKALAALEQEGAVTVSKEPGNKRNKVIRLKKAA